MSNANYIIQNNPYVQRFMAAAGPEQEAAVLKQLGDAQEMLGGRLVGRPMHSLDKEDIARLKVCEVASSFLNATSGQRAARDFDHRLGRLISEGRCTGHGGGFTLATQIGLHLAEWEKQQDKPKPRSDGSVTVGFRLT